jgi:hypothetical protein
MQRLTAPQARTMKARDSAAGAEYESQGQARSASPLETNKNAPPALKGRNTYLGLSGLSPSFMDLTRGDALASLALAPGFHIPRLWRLGALHIQRLLALI